MKRIDELTSEQKALMPIIAKKWIDRALSGVFDEDGIKEGVRWLYSTLKRNTPKIFFADCPYTAIMLVHALKNMPKNNSVRDSVGDSVRASVGDSVRASVGDIWSQRSSYCEYSDYHFCAWADFYQESQLACVKQHKMFSEFKKFIWANLFMAWFYEGIAVIVRPPTTITKNQEGRLHDATAPAIKFKNETSMYFIRGRAMPAKIFEQPITMEQFMAEQSEDVRAGMYEVLEERNGFSEMAGAEIASEETVVHDGGYMETISLYKTKEKFKGAIDALTSEENVQLAWLKLTCPSTGQQYMIPSFPSFKTATEAARYHRPEGIPVGMEYRWSSAN